MIVIEICDSIFILCKIKFMNKNKISNYIICENFSINFVTNMIL